MLFKCTALLFQELYFANLVPPLYECVCVCVSAMQSLKQGKLIFRKVVFLFCLLTALVWKTVIRHTMVIYDMMLWWELWRRSHPGHTFCCCSLPGSVWLLLLNGLQHWLMDLDLHVCTTDCINNGRSIRDCCFEHGCIVRNWIPFVWQAPVHEFKMARLPDFIGPIEQAH